MNRAEHQWTNLLELLGLSTCIFYRVDRDLAAFSGRNLGLAENVRNLQDGRFRAAADQVPAGNQPGIRCRGWLSRSSRRIIGEVAVQKSVPHRFASAGLSFSGAVIRNEKSDPGIQDQVQVAMEVVGIAGMTDNSVPVPGFLIEAEAHPVHVRQI